MAEEKKFEIPDPVPHINLEDDGYQDDYEDDYFPDDYDDDDSWEEDEDEE